MLEEVALQIPPVFPIDLVDTEFRTHGGRWITRPLKRMIPELMVPPVKPILVTDQRGLDEVTSFLMDVNRFGLDTETNRVPNFWDRKIRTIQIGNKETQYVIDLLAFAGSQTLLEGFQGHKGAWVSGSPLQPVVDAIRFACESNKWLKVGVNFEFDYMVLRWCLGLRPWHLWDCQLAEKIRWNGQVGFYERDFYAMDDLLKRYCGLIIDKTLQTSFDLCTPLTQPQVEYAGFDTRGPLAVMDAQVKVLEELGLMRSAQIENDAIPAFGDIRLNGMNLNKDKWRARLAQTRIEYAAAVALMDVFFIPVVGHKGVTEAQEAKLQLLEDKWKGEQERVQRAANRQAHLLYRQDLAARRKLEADCTGEANINYGSPAQLLATLRKMKYGVTKLPTTDDGVLEELAGDPCIDAIRQFRTAEKLLSAYGEENWLDVWTNTFDGRIHAKFNQFGADTLRTTCEKPNLHQIPKQQVWRSCFDAPPGKKIITCDWSGQELRLLTELSGEDSWREAFAKDQDVHSMCCDDLEPDVWVRNRLESCAFFLLDKIKCDCPKHKDQREGFKPVNFGIPYGKTEYALRRDLKCSLATAKTKLTKWYAKYKKHTKWLAWAADRATVHGEARTILGGRRLFPKFTWAEVEAKLTKKLKRPPTNQEISKKLRSTQGNNEKQGKNTPIQGSGAQMLKIALGCGFDPDGVPYLWHTLEPKYGALVVNEVHDEIVTESPEEVAEPVRGEIKSAMERAGAEMVKTIAMVAETSVADEWKK